MSEQTTILGFSVVNDSTVVSDELVATWCAAVQAQLADDVAPAWNLTAVPVRLQTDDEPVPDNWILIRLIDISTQPGAEGFHTDELGAAEAQVAIVTTEGAGDSPSVTFSHEVCEAFGNPFLDRWVVLPDGTQRPAELCDAVQSSVYEKLGVAVSDFVTPYYFDADSTQGQKLDQMGVLKTPFELAPGGYTVTQDAEGNVTQVFGKTGNIRTTKRATRLMLGHKK